MFLNNKRNGILIVFFAGALFVWGLASIASLIFIKNEGSKITAMVMKVDAECDRYNKIEVVFENKVYPVKISRDDCVKGTYKVGQSVTLIKYKDSDTLIWPKSKYEWLPFALLAILALAYYTNKDKFKSKKEKQ